MIFYKIEVGVYGVNAYILGDEDSKSAVVVDPGGNPGEIKKILQKEKLSLKAIILTHGHGDHIGGIPDLLKAYKVPVYIHEKDARILRDKNLNYSSRMPMEEVEIHNAVTMKDGDRLEFDGLVVDIIHTPGHSPGGITLKLEDRLITGDTLFKGSIGRSDLEGGNHDQLIASIKSKLLKLDKNYDIYPGHGPKTTLEREKSENPFLQ